MVETLFFHFHDKFTRYSSTFLFLKVSVVYDLNFMCQMVSYDFRFFLEMAEQMGCYCGTIMDTSVTLNRLYKHRWNHGSPGQASCMFVNLQM